MATFAASAAAAAGPHNSPTFEKDVSIRVDDDVGAASISPSGRDVVLAGKSGLRIIDLDNPYELPRHIAHKSTWEVADVQWSPFASRAEWIASTFNQKALIFNLSMTPSANGSHVEFTLHAHDRAISDINFSAHHPEILATCGIDSFVYTWDLRAAQQPAGSHQTDLKTPKNSFAHFNAGATQVKWNRVDEHIIASSHDRCLYIWDTRRGAQPLTIIKAHATKIYGVDWHRADRNKILTCSLDQTIKLWDGIGVNSKIDSPYRTINTDYPVWRARHTPFPNGILAMAKRGNSTLNLYSHADTFPTTPAHTFKAHAPGAQVQEFLWRSRGSADDGFDNREFQLVSWGTDHHLHLHSIKSDLLRLAVGFEKGAPVQQAPSTSRKNARYISYRSGPPLPEKQPVTQAAPLSRITALLQAKASAADPTSESRATMSAAPLRQSASRIVSHIKWITGVKIGERDGTSHIGRGATSRDTAPHGFYVFADDIANTARDFYEDVTWEKTDVVNRQVEVWLRGPWGTGPSGTDQLAALRLRFKFPATYPSIDHPLRVETETPTTTIDEDTLVKLHRDFNTIANLHAARGRKSLEAILNYALGRQKLEDSLAEFQPPGEDMEKLEPLATRDDSSSEDEFEGNVDDALTDLMNSSQTNANVPLPIQCTARFSVSGTLALARMPPSDMTRSLQGPPFQLIRHPLQARTKKSGFESLGRLPPADLSGDESDHFESSEGSWESSSTPSSSESDIETGAPLDRFQPPAAWQKGSARYQTRSAYQPSTNTAKTNKPTSAVVSILGSSVAEFISSKRHLALRYQMFGDGPKVCTHNAEVARSFGYDDLADIWELCKLILNNQVPLEILPQQHRREQVLVLARRALVRIKRKDSGLDLQFDEADTVTNPRLKGRIKWGHHSVVMWLIPALFDHFERLADTQMLAMLSCIFSEPAAREGVTNVMAKMRQSNLPMSMEAPAFSLDYFPSADAAWSLFRPDISSPSTPPYSRYATPVNEIGWHRLAKALDTYGSHGSSNGPWGSDALPSEPVTPYSTGNTPPSLSRAPTFRSFTTTNTPYSTSPEQLQTAKKQSSTNLASAFASISRPFATVLSTSPSAKTRTDDLSTSAPTNSVTWGATTFYSSGSTTERTTLTSSRTKHGKRASFGQADTVNIDYYSDSDSEYNDAGLALDGASEYTAPLTPREDGEEGGSINVTLKNQDKFDDEACVSAPLLDMRKEWLYRAWREQYAEMLGCWGLVSQRAEVLKFNGLVSYFPPGGSRQGSKPGSISLALKKENDSNDTSEPPSQPLSRTSTLAPPYISLGPFHRSPNNSPRHFSFNPEANEFRPGSPFSPEIPPHTPNVFVSSEQTLQLSIPTITRNDNDNDVEIGGEMDFDGVAESRMNLAPRPNLSRHASAVSGTSIQESRNGATGKKKKDPIYSCSICWIRVSGRFYLCPACGHVAHFACMDEGLKHEVGECVVGCGCGCGFEEDNEREIMEEGFRRWEERGGWLPDMEGDDERSYEGSLAGDVGKWSEDVANQSAEKLKSTNKAAKTEAKGKGKGKGRGKGKRKA